MNELHSIYKLDTPKQNHVTKKPQQKTKQTKQKNNAFIIGHLPILINY